MEFFTKKQQIALIIDVDEQVLKKSASQFSSEEKMYQALWQGFFIHTNIPESKNNMTV